MIVDMEELLTALRAAAEPTRIRLLALCARSQLTVTELAHILGQSQPRVSRHLKLLCDAGLLDRFREGTWVFYRLTQEEDAARFAAPLIDLIPGSDQTIALDAERLEAVKESHRAAAALYFRQNAARWDEIRSLYVDETEVEHALLDLLPSQDIHNLLDIGTGTGRMLELLGDRVRHAVGVDLSRDMLAVARANLERTNRPNCVVRQADMYKLPWAGESFDVVTIHQVLHFADEPDIAIAEAARVLRPGGSLIVVDFAPHELEYLRTDHAHRRLGFSDDQLEQWGRAAGLEPRSPIHLLGDPLTVAIWPSKRARLEAPRLGADRARIEAGP